MRCTILSLLLLLSALPLCAQFTNNRPFHLLFDTDNGTNTTLRVHSTQDAAQPLEQWAVVAQLMAVGVSTNYSVPVIASPPRQFFAVSASNEWGIVFSEVVVTEPPRSPRALRLVKD